MIQYSEAPAIESKSRGVLDTPQEPVIGLAEGETRWRGMTRAGERQSWESLRGANGSRERAPDDRLRDRSNPFFLYGVSLRGACHRAGSQAPIWLMMRTTGSGFWRNRLRQSDRLVGLTLTDQSVIMRECRARGGGSVGPTDRTQALDDSSETGQSPSRRSQSGNGDRAEGVPQAFFQPCNAGGGAARGHHRCCAR